MTIRLKIDNLDTLPDGGPLHYTGVERGFSIGRNETLDWTLPDPSRFISGKHCEIRFEDGGYWLSDVSTNGTFLNGSRQRMKSPHRLCDGDRIGIGHYVISASVEGRPEFPAGDALDAGVDPGRLPADDIWGSQGPAPAPIDRRGLMPARRQGQRAPDFSQEFLGLPEMRPVDGDPFGARPGFETPAEREFFGVQPSNLAPSAPLAPPSRRDYPAEGAAPAGRGESFFSDPRAAGGRGELPHSARGRGPAMQEQAAVMPMSRSASEAIAASEVLRRFAEGAGLDPMIFEGRDAGETAEEIGQVMRIVVEDVQQLLKARQAAKVLARSSKRTMLGRINNPLKFLPTPEEILEVMFTGRRAGYLAAVAAFEEAFGDLKRHEMATYAAMQSALSRLLLDLSPEAIEGKVTGSAFASRKARNWDMYVARWEAKTEPYENGMLDVFLTYFAEAYDEGQADR